MSAVSDLMRRRRLQAGAAALGATRLTMAQLVPGQRATVTGYGEEMEADTARRLFDLGLTPGIEVEMVRRAPLGDPVIFRVGDYEVALRSVQSRGIHVEAVR
jgi:ferrous iron transport protein A